MGTICPIFSVDFKYITFVLHRHPFSPDISPAGQVPKPPPRVFKHRAAVFEHSLEIFIFQPIDQIGSFDLANGIGHG